MTVLNQYYQISEQTTSKVGVHWKVFHISLFAIITFCGFITVFSFQSILSDFNNFCILDAHIAFSNTSFIYPELELYLENEQLNITASNATTVYPAISLQYTHWGNKDRCDFVGFTPLTSTLFAIIWTVFFVILSKGGAGYGSDILPNPWRIVFPCFIFATIFSIVLLASTVMMLQGFNKFCAEFIPETNITECNQLINVWTIQFKSMEKPFFPSYQLTKISAYLGLLGWFFQVFLLIVRVITVTDFKIEFVQIMDKNEEIQKVTQLDGEQV